MINCTINYLENNILYNIFQNIAYCLLAIYIIGINVSAIVLTLVGQNCWKCPVNKMMMSGHISNIFAIISFTMNDLYYPHNGTTTKPGCKPGLDHYFFAYIGLMGATITLLFNSISTYTGIVRNSWMVSENPTKNCKTFTLIWVISIGLSIALVLIQNFHPGYLFVKGSSLGMFFIVISCGFLIRVIRVLNRSRNATGCRAESQLTIQKAIFMVRLSVICYTCTMVTGVIGNVAAYVVQKDIVVLSVIWLLKLLQCIMFTLEPHLCILKHPKPWRMLWRKYLCGRSNGESGW